MSQAGRRGRRARRRPWIGPIGLLALLAYLPAVLTAPGVVAADTKQYLYLDPGRYLAGVTSLWDPSMFGGWVTHQTIGYLWPMGPVHWLLSEAGVPVWLAQRLWLGSLLLAGGAGVWWCCRVFGLSRAGATAGAVLYQLSPYALLYAPRTSVLLLPWAGLGWLLGLTVLAARRGGWRYPAAAALVVGTVSGTNATAALLCALAPGLWLGWAVWGSREMTWRRALAAGGRIAVLSIGVSAAWIASILVQAHYGADVLGYSETLEAVSTTSLGSEVLRGLGYWLFYGGDVTGPWNSASIPYLSAPVLIGLGFVLVALAMAAAVLVRWAQRGFVALLVLVGVVVSVGAHPLNHPSLYGRLLTTSTRSTIVLALRSSTRALPIVLLGFALAVAAGVSALAARLPSTSVLAAGAVVGLAVLNLPGLWTGTYVDGLQRRPEDIPASWTAAAAALAQLPAGTRVLELPGAEFAAYRWGTTNDAILPGLTDRPTLTRDLLPLGSPGLMDLAFALDDRFQTGTVESQEIAPVARLLGAGAVVVRGDTAFERYRTPRPEPTEALYASTPPGLGQPTAFGPPAPNPAAVAGLDETSLSDPSIARPVAPVEVVPVTQPAPIVRTRTTEAPVVLSGDGEGIVDAAAAGLVDGSRPVIEAASVTDPARLATLANEPGATLVLTDTNRDRARQWRGSQDTTGFTEDGHDGVLEEDPADVRLPAFPGALPGMATVAEQEGGAIVRATAYGEPNAYRPEDRPIMAVDGDLTTAWRVGDRGEVIGERLRIDLDHPRAVSSLHLVQPLDPSANRWITELDVTTDRGRARVSLDAASRTAAGQTIALPASIAGITSRVELEVAATNVGRLASYAGIGPVGFAEVGVGDLRLEEVVVVPTAVLSAAGAAAAGRELDVVLTRLRHDPRDRWRSDEELALVRRVTLPAARTFRVEGTARLSAAATDAVIAGLVARPVGVTARASSRLAGVPADGGPAAVDGDLTSAWTTAFGSALGAQLDVDLGRPTVLDALDLSVVNDGEHSVPTELVLRDAGGDQRIVAVPTPPKTAPGARPTPVRVSFPPLATARFSMTVATESAVTTVDRRYGDVVTLPVAIAELGLPTVSAPLPATFDTGCRADLLTVDGRPVPLRVHGSTEDLLARRPLPIEPCGPASAGLGLAAGPRLLHAAPGTRTGLDLDRLVLRSAATPAPAAAVGPAPTVSVTGNGRNEITGTVRGDGTRPFWLVLGQGLNAGWRATLDGHDLGAAQSIDGGMNGWLVPAGVLGAGRFRLWWAPQRWVDASLAVAAASTVVALLLLLLPRRRRHRPWGNESAPIRCRTEPQVGVEGGVEAAVELVTLRARPASRGRGARPWSLRPPPGSSPQS